jgi:hypothetical protein
LDASIVTVSYINHKENLSLRRIRPIRIWFGSTAWHPEPQWFLEVFDLDKMETRDFAMSGLCGGWQKYEVGQ